MIWVQDKAEALAVRLAQAMAVKIILITVVIDIVHPFIHNTPLDSGMLDALQVHLNLIAAQLAATGD